MARTHTLDAEVVEGDLRDGAVVLRGPLKARELARPQEGNEYNLAHLSSLALPDELPAIDARPDEFRQLAWAMARHSTIHGFPRSGPRADRHFTRTSPWPEPVCSP